MVGDNSTKVSTKQRLFLAVIVVVLLVVGVLLFVLNYSNLWSGKTGNNTAVNSSSSVNLQKLTQDYKQEFSSIMTSYLAQDPSSPQFLELTNNAKGGLLELTVPAVYKDTHLSAVLELDKISLLISTNSQNKVPGELDKLTKIANSL